jgi:hypothetical protein
MSIDLLFAPSPVTDLLSVPTTAEAQAQAANFSIDDYGRDEGVYQVLSPSYPAPQFLRQYNYLAQALRECSTLCRLEGRPFRAVRWGREGAGARGGVPCKACCPSPPGARFPRKRYSSCGCLEGFPELASIAEFRPDGQQLVWGPGCCKGRLVGGPNYAVSHTPFVRTYVKPKDRVRYTQGMAALQYIAGHTGQRAYLCSGLLADCKSDDPSKWVPMVYVDPGGIVRRYDRKLGNEVGTSVMNADQLREYYAMSRGRSTLPKGA